MHIHARPCRIDRLTHLGYEVTWTNNLVNMNHGWILSQVTSWTRYLMQTRQLIWISEWGKPFNLCKGSQVCAKLTMQPEQHTGLHNTDSGYNLDIVIVILCKMEVIDIPFSVSSAFNAWMPLLLTSAMLNCFGEPGFHPEDEGSVSGVALSRRHLGSLDTQGLEGRMMMTWWKMSNQSWGPGTIWLCSKCFCKNNFRAGRISMAPCMVSRCWTDCWGCGAIFTRTWMISCKTIGTTSKPSFSSSESELYSGSFSVWRAACAATHLR